MARGGRRSTTFKPGDPRARTSSTWTAGVDNGGTIGNRGNPDPPNKFGKGNPGRPKGCKNRTQIGAEFVAKEGLTDKERPLSFFVAMMKGEPFKVRKVNPADGKIMETEYFPTLEDMKWGAAMAAPYMHPKLANIQHSGDVTLTHENFLDQLDEDDAGDSVRH